MKLNRNWLADTLALISFTVVTGMFIEIAIVGMTLQQSIISRLMCQPLNISLGRLYGLYRDFIIGKFSGNKKSVLKEALGDITAYLTFQLPPYIVILVVVGMDVQGIITASVSQTLALLVFGAPYGYWLRFVRRKLISGVDMMVPAAV